MKVWRSKLQWITLPLRGSVPASKAGRVIGLPAIAGKLVPIAQWIRRQTSDLEILGSIPSRDFQFARSVSKRASGDLDEFFGCKAAEKPNPLPALLAKV